MQSEKSKKLLTSLVSLCDGTMGLFYIAATSGLVSNKMACIDYAYKLLYESTKSYNILAKDSDLVASVNSSIHKLSCHSESVEQTFGVMFNTLQQYRLALTAWLGELDPS